MIERFQQNELLLRRKVLKLFGGAFHIYDMEGNILFYSKQKAFKLKEDIRLYTDESMSTELIRIQARAIIDWSASYDVIDVENDQKIGALRRKGWSSMLRDHWLILDADDNQVGEIVEDSQMMALLRRFLTSLIPQNFDVNIAGKKRCDFAQQFNPFVYKLNIIYQPDADAFERIMSLCAAVLLAAVEGRQSGG
jgi:uncharacterized protein YxjI